MDLEVFLSFRKPHGSRSRYSFKKGGLNISHAINSRLSILWYPVIWSTDSSPPPPPKSQKKKIFGEPWFPGLTLKTDR
jgi:hypothetical protein